MPTDIDQAEHEREENTLAMPGAASGSPGSRA
jgi:hypothetical protein